jgi:hypothetical protein
MIISFCFVRRHICFRWSEVAVALWRSAVVMLGSAAGPACVVAFSDGGLDLSIGASLLAMLLAVIGWLTAVLAVQHPVLLELGRARDHLSEVLRPKLFGLPRAGHGVRPEGQGARTV